ncbi:MAG TPA: YggT family protein [Gemmatimonadales bacterium]|jgi:YggT family protein|nr:YggT family protein [Gemmatimonadales bacterium]
MVGELYFGLRIIVVLAVIFTVVVAVTHGLVRGQKLAAFGWWARAVRRVSDPVVQPIERRLVRAGGNPQHATLWLMALSVVLGLVLLWFYRWLVGTVAGLAYMAQGGPQVWIAELVHWVFAVLKIALIVRVIGSWLGATPYTRWMRPFVTLTEWMLAPLRRVIPTMGMLDFTPLVAYFILIFAERAVMRLLLG